MTSHVEDGAPEAMRGPALKDVLGLLSPGDVESLWQFACRYVQNLRVPKGAPNTAANDFDALCAAVSEAEHRPQTRATIVGLPRTTKRLSVNELQKAVARLRDRLFVTSRAADVITTVFCQWVKLVKNKELVNVLDAVGCGHDEVGSLVGDIPELVDAEVLAAVSTLVGHDTVYDIVIVCAGLAINHPKWLPLWLVIPRLQNLAVREPKLLPPTSTSPGGKDVPTALLPTGEQDAPPAADVELLCKQLDQLGLALTAALAEIAQGECPEAGDVFQQWQTTEATLQILKERLGTSTRSIELLQHAELEQLNVVRDIAVLQRIHALKHVSDPTYVAHNEAVARAREALELISAGQSSAAASLLGPLKALDALVERADTLGEDEALALDESVRAAFGATLALSALRGRLVVGSAGSATDSVAVATTPVVSAPAPQAEPERDGEPVLPEPVIAAQPTGATGFSILPTTQGAVSQEVIPPSEESTEPAFVTALIPTISGEKGEALAAVLGSTPTAVSTEPIPASRSGGSASAPARPVFDDSVKQFRSMNWIDTAGRVGKAPWAEPNFYTALSHKATTEWQAGRLGYAYFMAEVALGHGVESRLDVEDLRAADRLLERPVDLAVLRDQDRATRVRTALESGEVESTSAAIGLVMEALAPTFPQAWSSEEVVRLASRAQFTAPGLETIIAFLLNGWAAAADPLDLIRSDIQRKLVSPEELARNYGDAKSGFQRVVATLWSAAGGRIVHTHSKRAWTIFMEQQVAPLRDLLAPRREQRKEASLSVAEAHRRVAALGQSFVEIMREVKHQDRTAAVAGADQIVAAIEKVVATKQQLAQQERKFGASFGAVPHTEAVQLITELPSNSKDKLCTLLLRAALFGQSQRNPLRLPAGYLRQAPDLVRTLRPEVLVAEDLADGIRVSEFKYRSEAAALLLSCGTEDSGFTGRAELFEHLRNHGIEENRSDILAALVPGNTLQAHEKTQLHRRALELGDEAYNTARQLERAWAACDELIEPQAPRFKKLVDEAFLHCAMAVGETPIGESILLQSWLDEAVALVESARDAIAAIRLGQARSSPKQLGHAFQSFLDTQDYRAAMALLHSDEIPLEGSSESARRTMWRAAAIDHYRNPRATLLQELKGVPGVQSLVSWWAQPGENDPTYRDGLRKGLYNLVSGEAGYTQDEVKRRFSVKLTELREHKERKTVIKCTALREYFRAARLNPTFLPQLAELDQIILTTLPVLAQSSVPLDNYIRSASAEGSRALSVFLEPTMSLGRRDEIAAGLRRRNVRAVILDDIDICRLCAIGADAEGHNFIPLLEIVFEQLDLELVSPFSTQDGQHIRLESFIGRTASAARIAEGWDYTRLFSGRKLGKSAFLRYVASTYDGYKLASGKDLSVIFITVAGGSSESWVVDTIIQEMSRRFSLPQEMESSVLSDPVDRFMRYALRFAKARKTDNVLVILDEADTFIEEQLASYDRVRERSLSFCMMKRMPTPEGGDEMPRLRFLFSGYRVTNTRGGVWANAGDVLILQPLTEDEAVSFLRGMLGRIGVNIGSHAPFAARRCGFQPAVLIRFGESLLKRIKRNSRTGMRETYIVTHDDVIATMSDQAVMDEIRTVVNNNFQGNRLSAAVFGGALVALKDLQPGMALEDGPQQVLNKLAAIDSDVSWLGAMGASPLAQIERQLQEFIDRELLTVSDAPRFGSREYRLKFPHFLSVLTQQTDVGLQVRQHIQHLREGASPGRIVESVLPDTSLDAVRYVFRESPVAECSVAVVAGHWMKALADDKVGVPDRLGCNPSAVARALAPGLVAERVGSGYRVFTAVGEPLWRTMVATRLSKPLLAIGGVDLLRLGLKHLLEGVEPPIDVRSFVTMSKSTLHWWFEGARALHFAAGGALDDIYALTSGIPLLVGELDGALLNASATDVSVGELQIALQSVKAAIPKLAESLVNGPAEVRLTARELELLVMATRVARDFDAEFDLQKDFAEAWEMLGDGDGDGDAALVPPLKDERDRLSLQVLLGVGLLPAATLGPLGGAGDLGRVRFDRGSLHFTLLTALDNVRAR